VQSVLLVEHFIELYEMNIKCYNSEFESERIIRSSKIQPSFNVPTCDVYWTDPV